MCSKNKSKIWVIVYLVVVVGILSLIAMIVINVDPFFHYSKPQTDKYFYNLNNQRSQNYGITKLFDYDAMITGSSMTENFMTTEFDELFGTNSIKVSYSGGRFKEVNDNIRHGLESNPDLKTVLRSIDMMMLITNKDNMRTDLGEYPTYLYDENALTDVYYLFNRDVVYKRAFPMVERSLVGSKKPGITSFDVYSAWCFTYDWDYGMKHVCKEGMNVTNMQEPVWLTANEKAILELNIKQNITDLVKEYPDVTFYYFIPPYSAVWWGKKHEEGTFYKQIEAERYVINELLKCDNVKLFSFNNLTDITTDINNYDDTMHYGEWINSLMLKYMKEEKCLLTKDNVEEYFDKEFEFYKNFDYNSLNNQEDYEDNSLARKKLGL